MGVRAFNGTLDLKFSGNYKNTLTDSYAPTLPITTDQIAISLSGGTGDNQADRLWPSKSRALTGGSSETIDIYDLGSVDIGAGAGLDPLGQAFAQAGLMGIVVILAAGSAGSLHVDTSLVNGHTGLLDGTVKLKATSTYKSVFVIMVPAAAVGAITDGSNHLIKFEAVGGNVTYDAYLLGRSA